MALFVSFCDPGYEASSSVDLAPRAARERRTGAGDTGDRTRHTRRATRALHAFNSYVCTWGANVETRHVNRKCEGVHTPLYARRLGDSRSRYIVVPGSPSLHVARSVYTSSTTSHTRHHLEHTTETHRRGGHVHALGRMTAPNRGASAMNVLHSRREQKCGLTSTTWNTASCTFSFSVCPVGAR